MKHPTVILLTLFALQINAFPHPTLTRSISENEDVKSSVDSTGITNDLNKIPLNKITEQKSTSEIKEIVLRNDKEIISSDTKDLPPKENIRLESKSLISDSSTTNPVKEEKSNQENSDAGGQNNESAKPKSMDVESKDKIASSEEIPTSRSNKDNDEPISGNVITDASIDLNSIPEPTKIETMQRPPSYYYDMLNIPITVLQAVSNLLGGSPTKPTYVRPPATSKPEAVKEYLRSPAVGTDTGSSGIEPDSSANANVSSIANLSGLIAQISQFANNKPELVGLQIFRLPTIQDIINIPISTLNAVSHFLAENYATKPAPVSSPPVASNVAPSKVPIENTTDPKKNLLKSGPLLQTLGNIPDHSTLIGVTEEHATTNEQVPSLDRPKPSLIAYSQQYHAMINIPLATLKAVKEFLASVSSEPSLLALPVPVRENIKQTEGVPSLSPKTS